MVPNKDIAIFPGVRFSCPEAIRIGGGVSINYNVFIDASNGFITIGNDVLIGPNCVLRAANHVYSNPHQTIKSQGHIGGHIIIEDDCWLRANVIILKDARIGKGSIIAASSVVTGDFPPYTVLGGIPARLIGHREKKENH